MSTIRDQTEQIIDLAWDAEKYRLFSAGDDAPSVQELEAFAEEYGVKFPAEFLAHASRPYAGVYIEVKENHWPRIQGGAFWKFLYGLFVYAFGEEAPDWMQIRVAAEEFKSKGHQVVPFLKIVGDADVYCFDAAERILKWSHETDSFEVQEESFFGVFKHEYLRLEERRKRIMMQQ